MGTVATFVAEGSNRAAATGRLEALVQVVEEAESDLTTYRTDSILASINRQAIGKAFWVPAELCDLFGRIRDWWDGTGRAFDPAVGRLVEIWGLREGGRRPTQEELRVARSASGLENVSIDLRACSVTRLADVTLDAGGFGKGFALDKVRSAGAANDRSWLVNLGGQVAVSGVGPDSAWTVDLAHPEQRDTPVVEVVLRSGSLATSGPSERDLILPDGSRIGHIIDPRSGLTVSHSGSVTVWHEEAFVADVLSTAMYVMGLENGLAWAQANDLAACILFRDAGSQDVSLRATAAFRERFLRP